MATDEQKAGGGLFVPIEFDQEVIMRPVLYGELFRIPRTVSRSGRYRFKRGTNRRMRRCRYGSPRWVWLSEEYVRRSNEYFRRRSDGPGR